jgi:hypothetical protein
MLRTTLLATAALGTALALAAGPALAQSGMTGSGMTGSGMMGQATPMASSGWNQVAVGTDRTAPQEVGGWLSQADQALRGGRTGQARELLERAETRMLSRSIPVTMSGQPVQGPVVDNIAAARRALESQDRSGAMQSIASAQAALGSMPREDMATGSGAGMAPAQGGGMQGGGMMLRDGGHAGTSMNRADVFGLTPGHDRAPAGPALAQAGGGGGGGGMGEQSGGLQGSTPGSPGTGTLGSTPQNTLGLSQQPAQGSATTLAPNQGGRAAPVPGTGGVQVPGGTGQMPGDARRGAPTPGSSR